MPPQSLHCFLAKATRGHKNIRASHALPSRPGVISFYITVFTEVEPRSFLLAKMLIKVPVGLWVFPHLLGPNSNLGVTFKLFQSFLMTTVLFTPCFGVLGGVAVFHLRNFCGW